MEVVTKKNELWLRAQSGVANVSLRWSRECESLMGVTSGVMSVSCESESRAESRNVGRKCGSQM